MHTLIPQYVDYHAEHRPQHVAVKLYDEQLSYAELSARSDQLAAFLLENGLRRGDRVGVYQGKSLESAIAIHGIMKAGGAYVPIDSGSPLARVEQVVKDCGIRQLVSMDRHSAALQQLVEANNDLTQVLGITHSLEGAVASASWSDIALTPTTVLNGINVSEHDLAYIIYTSGSTGQPKGIMHTHYSSLSFCRWAANTYQIGVNDKIGNQAALHFDISVFDYFVAAVAGATTVIVAEEYLKMPASYSQLLEQEKITTIFTVPFVLSQLLHRGVLEQRNLEALRWILFGGDTHSPAHIRQLMQLLPQARFSNVYGPAETNGCTFLHVPDLPEDSDEPIGIGGVCDNMEALVLDGDNKPVSVGEVGELLMRGPTLMQGYWNQPNLNAKAFYQPPDSSDSDDPYYRTGDVVEVLSEDNYRFAGRVDRQAKVRGYRVELDEIEMALCSHSAVEEAAAFVVSGEEGNGYIEAAVILNAETADEGALLKTVKQLVPVYAVPQRIECVVEFPRTGSGKINRRELQARAASRSRS